MYIQVLCGRQQVYSLTENHIAINIIHHQRNIANVLPRKNIDIVIAIFGIGEDIAMISAKVIVCTAALQFNNILCMNCNTAHQGSTK